MRIINSVAPFFEEFLLIMRISTGCVEQIGIKFAVIAECGCVPQNERIVNRFQCAMAIRMMWAGGEHCFAKTSTYPTSGIPRNGFYLPDDASIEPMQKCWLFVQELYPYIAYSTFIFPPLQVVRAKALLQVARKQVKIA